MIRRVLAVLGCIMLGMSLGGVLHARDRIEEVRTCEEIDDDEMVCDDDTTCTLVGGVWVCTPNAPAALN
jgi:hypothetical protein